MTRSQRFPNGWNEERVRRLLEYYEAQTDEEAVAEDEAALEGAKDATMTVPVDLVPAVRELISRHRRTAWASPDEVPVPEWHLEVLEKRLADPDPQYLSWEEVRERLKGSV